MKNKKLKDLLDYVSKGKICPEPIKWSEMYNMLPDKNKVPLPLILAGWWGTSDIEKIFRFKEHIEIASKQGVLDEVDTFLRNLETEDWYPNNE